MNNSIKVGPLVFLYYMFLITENIMKRPVYCYNRVKIGASPSCRNIRLKVKVTFFWLMAPGKLIGRRNPIPFSFFRPEYGGSSFLRNLDTFLLVHATAHSRRHIIHIHCHYNLKPHINLRCLRIKLWRKENEDLKSHMAFRGVKVCLRSFLTTALNGCEWSALCPGRFSVQCPWNRRLDGA